MDFLKGAPSSYTSTWESMAVNRTLWALFIKFGTVIQDCLRYLHRNTGAQYSPIRQSWTYFYNNNSVSQCNWNMIPLSSDSLCLLMLISNVNFHHFEFSTILTCNKNFIFLPILSNHHKILIRKKTTNNKKNSLVLGFLKFGP